MALPSRAAISVFNVVRHPRAFVVYLESDILKGDAVVELTNSL